MITCSNLIDFLNNADNNVEARRILSISQHGNGVEGHGFPWACASIAMTSLLMDALKNGDLDDVLLRRGANREQFDRLHQSTFANFTDAYCRSKPKTVMDFTPFLNDFKGSLQF